MVDSIAQRLVDALYAGTPVPSGCRVNHARGTLVEGRFVATAHARALCRAAVFAGGERTVLARFSSSTGRVDIAENDAAADPRGLALAVGNDFVLVGHSVEAFPASTPDEFLGFIEALNVAGEDPGRLQRHMLDFAAARRFDAARSGHPSSFAAMRYHMLHTYRLNSSEGHSTLGRLSVSGEVDSMGDAGDRLADPDYLSHELHDRLAEAPVEMRLEFTEARHGDAIGDIAAAWPDRGPSVTLGRVILDRIAADQDAQRRLVFDPARQPEGMSFAGDPMIDARLEAYRIASERRTRDPQ